MDILEQFLSGLKIDFASDYHRYKSGKKLTKGSMINICYYTKGFICACTLANINVPPILDICLMTGTVDRFFADKVKEN